ncbi:HAMP domain-containing histidine kinase [Sphingosinicellaceae bacterium]|nr:HAMP domain-containing histidine kinase [Sphingosinicellaceae bacterium]
MSRLYSDVTAVQQIAAVPTILGIACRTTGMGLSIIARVTDESWTACAVHDCLDADVKPGDELDVMTTLCGRVGSDRAPVVIKHLAPDAPIRDQLSPAFRRYQSYIAMPIILGDGEVFGTLCAFDDRPMGSCDPTVLDTFRLFAELIAFHLESSRRLDVSEAALLDANETSRLRDQFIAVLGHDLRNPVAAIESGTRLLEKKPLDVQALRIVGLMRDSARRMSHLINDVLDLARGQLGGGLTLNRASEPALGPLLDHVIAEIRIVSPTRSIISDISLGEPVACDTARIGQLLSNLLANAIAHGDSEGPIVARAHTSDGVFTLSVTNSGPPIPPGIVPMLFKPFSRGGDGSPQMGLGLGLYIVAEIAKAHGGFMNVQSTDAKTTFSLTMPCAMASSSGIA